MESVSGLTHEEAEVACLRANQRMEGIKAADMGTANLHMRAQIGGCLLLLCGAIALLSRQASKTRQSGAARPERHGQPLASPAGAEQDTRTGLLALG